MLALGGLAYKAFQRQCQALRLRPKADMIQARKNRQERVSLPETEDAPDAQFAACQARPGGENPQGKNRLCAQMDNAVFPRLMDAGKLLLGKKGIPLFVPAPPRP